jgi:repressor LexA
VALTPKQKEFLDFLAQFIEVHGYSPSYQEIAQGLNIASISTVHKHVSALEAKRYIRRAANRSRSLELAPEYLQERSRQNQLAGSAGIPLLGRIAAGSPVEAVSQPETLTLDDFTRSDQIYALKVRGDSMIEDHICDGDYVLVERTPDVKDGDIVVALVSGSEATLKRFYREPGHVIRLQPANASMAPIRLPQREVTIQGRVLAVLRKFK